MLLYNGAFYIKCFVNNLSSWIYNKKLDSFSIFIDWVVDILSNLFSFLLAVTTSRQRRRWQKYIYIIAKTSDCMQVFTGQFSVQAHIITNQKFHLKLYLLMLAVVKETHVNCLWVIYHKYWWFLYLLSVIVLTLEPFCLYKGFSCTIGKLPSFYPKYFFSCLSLIFDCPAWTR